MSAEDQKLNEEIVLKEFFKVISKSKFKEDCFTDPKNICYKFIDGLTGACYNLKNFEELLDVCFERIDEYTDKYKQSNSLPDFYLRSKVNGVPDLAIEVKRSEWVCSRDLKEHRLSIGDIEFYIMVNSGNLLSPLLPKEVMNSWNELENELKNKNTDLEYILKYILDKTNNVIDKEEWLRRNIGNFLEKYFLEKTSKHTTVEIKNNHTFVVKFSSFWEKWGNQKHSVPEFSKIERIEEFIKESKQKFENLRKVKSNKSDENHHLELLLIEATFIATENLKDDVRELREKLMRRGYNYPIYLVADSDNSLNRYFIICMNIETESFNGEIR